MIPILHSFPQELWEFVFDQQLLLVAMNSYVIVPSIVGPI